MSLQTIAEWYYLIYLLPFGLSFLMILASAFGGSHHRGGHGHGGEQLNHGGHSGGHFKFGGFRSGIGHSHGGGGLHDHGLKGFRLGHDHSGGEAVPHGHAHPQPSSHGSVVKAAQDTSYNSAAPPRETASEQILSFFGIGRVPLLMLAQGFGLSWGAAGFYATRLYQEAGTSPAQFIPWALLWAAGAGLAGSKMMGTLGARLMPYEETFAMGKEDLIGLIGTVVFPVSSTMGRVHVYDAYGTLHDESARLCPDQSETLEKGTSVILVDYDNLRGCFRVERSPV